jgi:hypothetical protein
LASFVGIQAALKSIKRAALKLQYAPSLIAGLLLAFAGAAGAYLAG